MRTHANSVRKSKPWAGLSAFFPTARPASKRDIQIQRKVWHVGMMVALIPLYSHVIKTQEAALLLTALIGGPIVIFDFWRLRSKPLNRFFSFMFGPLMRKRELGSLSSMSYFIVGLFMMLALFPEPVLVAAILCLAFGDPIACIVGIKYGKDIIIKGKSLQGSMACFITCTVVTFLVLYAYGIATQYLLFISIMGGFAATLAELLSTKINIDDNLIMPVTAASIIYPLVLLLAV